MCVDDGRKLDHKTLEQLRIRAVGQIEQGANPADIAAALGMTRAAVYAWLAKYRGGGLDALKARPVPGRAPKLSGAQLARLYLLVVGNDPRQLRFVFALWTRAMVRELIRREFGVRLSEVSVGRLLRKLGLSPQRPLYRAWQQNPEAVARWKVEAYPTIRAQAAEVGATIYFADEAGVRSDYHAGTTWAPVGQTPVVAATGERFVVNLISAVTAKGALRFAAYDGNLNGPVFIDFCRRLLDDSPGPVFLVLMAIRRTAPTPSSSSPRPPTSPNVGHGTLVVLGLTVTALAVPIASFLTSRSVMRVGFPARWSSTNGRAGERVWTTEDYVQKIEHGELVPHRRH
jgi:transposase